MSIILPADLPACKTLAREGIEVQEQESQHTQTSRPATRVTRIGLLNLMPNKQTTEEHFARVLGQGDAAVELVLLRLESRDSKRTDPAHLQRFYTSWTDAANLDGVIVTGAPVEHLPYAQVDYWDELTAVFDWLHASHTPALFICWAAQAALYHQHGIQKQAMAHKKLGLFAQQIVAKDALLLGLKDGFEVPVARQTEVPEVALNNVAGLQVLAASVAGGVFVAREKARPHYYAFNHLEYTADTIVEEYFREVNAGVSQPLPQDYFPSNDITQMPTRRWAKDAAQFYANWVHLCAQHTTQHTIPERNYHHDHSNHYSRLSSHRCSA